MCRIVLLILEKETVGRVDDWFLFITVPPLPLPLSVHVHGQGQGQGHLYMKHMDSTQYFTKTLLDKSHTLTHTYFI